MIHSGCKLNRVKRILGNGVPCLITSTIIKNFFRKYILKRFMVKEVLFAPFATAVTQNSLKDPKRTSIDVL